MANARKGNIDLKSMKTYGSKYYETAGFLDKLWFFEGYVHDDDNGYNWDSATAINKLLKRIPQLPRDTFFDEGCYKRFLELMEERNEARIVREMTPLMVPSPSGLLIQGKITDNSLYDAINETWHSAIPILNARPKPDISVGFKIYAFTRAQITKLEPTKIGDDPSYYMGASRMWFPFLTCKAKGNCNTAARQNALSMTIAIRGVATLAQRANKPELIDRRILAISIFHNANNARIDGYYPVYSEDRTKYTIHRSQLLETFVKSDRWACHSFVRNIYGDWADEHLKLLRKLMDELP